MSKKTINIIITTWNALEYTKLAIQSLFDYTDYETYLTIVDNGSSDGTLDFLDSLIPNNKITKIKVIKNKKNLGPGAAQNLGYKAFKTDYIVVANNDVLFTPNWLSKMVKIYSETENVGMLAPLRPAPFCLHPYTKGSTDDVLEGLPDTPDAKSELNLYCKGETFEQFVKDVLKKNTFGLLEVFGPPIHIVTCCAMISSQLIDSVGGLADPSFVVFGSEDTDLSWRVSSYGKRLLITSDVYVHHFKHKSSDANKLDRRESNKINNLIFYKKWEGKIKEFMENETNNGVNLKEKMESESDYNYWFLRRLNENMNFWKNKP